MEIPDRTVAPCQHDIAYDEMHLRENADSRPDIEVKREMAEQILESSSRRSSSTTEASHRSLAVPRHLYRTAEGDNTPADPVSGAGMADLPRVVAHSAEGGRAVTHTYWALNGY